MRAALFHAGYLVIQVAFSPLVSFVCEPFSRNRLIVILNTGPVGLFTGLFFVGRIFAFPEKSPGIFAPGTRFSQCEDTAYVEIRDEAMKVFSGASTRSVLATIEKTGLVPEFCLRTTLKMYSRSRANRQEVLEIAPGIF